MGGKQSLKCPECGSSDIEVIRSWTLTSPLPDAYGRITVTVMGVMKCRSCGHTWKGVVSKLKVGGEGAGPEREEGEERRGKEIVLDLDEIMKGE